MIPIQVLGTGLIPRGYGLAPRTKPFMADRLLIGTILATPGLIVNFVNPETGAVTKITSKNMDRLITKWSGWTGKVKEAPAAKPAPKQSNSTGTTPDGRAAYKGQVITGGVNTNTHAMNQVAPQQEKKAEVVTPPTPPAAHQETKTAETKPVDTSKTETTVEKKDEVPADKKDEQKEIPETTNTQKNNAFKPVSQNKNNQNGSEKK